MTEMAQRAPLRVQVPTFGNSPSERFSKYQSAFSPSPTPVIYQRPSTGWLWIATFLQLSALYAAHQWLVQSQHEQKVAQFAFLSFLGASVALGFLQKPWKGRAISSPQWVMVLVSGGFLALSFFLRMRGLANVGPLETILAEYAGAVVGKVLLKPQRKVLGIGDAKVRGAVAFLIGLYFLSQGWAISSCSPLSTILLPASRTSGSIGSARLTRSARIGNTAASNAFLSKDDLGSVWGEDCAKYRYIMAPVFAGLLSSMQKLLPSRTSLATVPRKRAQALSYLTAGAICIPVALFQVAFLDRTGDGLNLTVLWPLFSMVALGMVVAFYGEFFSEEKLLISQLSPFHFFTTACVVCLLELIYGSNFSLSGFIFCCAILAFGVRSGAFISGGLDWNSISEKDYSGSTLLSMLKTPVYEIWKDVKTRKIAMFLLLNSSFMVVEFLYGFLSNSLGLISDACHMLFDCAALAIGLYASYISRLPSNSRFNFGYGRFEVLSGFANAVFLILVASLIVLESIERLLEPPEISTESLLVVSVGGFLVNVVGLIFFHEAHHHAHGSAPCTHTHRTTSEKVAAVTAPKGEMWQHSHTPSAPSENFHSQVLNHQGRQDPLNLHPQQSPTYKGYDTQLQSSSSEFGGWGSNSLLRTEQTVQHLEAENQNHGSKHHVHSSSQGPPIPGQSDSHLCHEHHADHQPHTEFCSLHHDHHHSDNMSPQQDESSLEDLYSASHLDHHDHQHSEQGKDIHFSHSHTKHQHSDACKHSHGPAHNQKNPFGQQSHLHLKHHHSTGVDLQNPFVHQYISQDNHLHSENGSRNYPDSEGHPLLQQSASLHPVKHHQCQGHSHHDHKDHHHENICKGHGKQDHEHSSSLDGSKLDNTEGDHHNHKGHHHEDHQHDHNADLHGHYGHDHHPEAHHHGHQGDVHDRKGHDYHPEAHHHDHQGDVHNHKGHDHYPEAHHHDHQDDVHDHKGHDHLHEAHHYDRKGDVHDHKGHDHNHAHDHKGHDHHHVGHHHDHKEDVYDHKGDGHDHKGDYHDHHGHHHHHESHHNHYDGHKHDHDHNHDHDEGGHHHIDHNMEGIFLHILADTLGSVGVVISTLLIKYKGWLFTDPACSIFISLLIVSSVLPLFRNSAELLLQRIPRSAEKRIQKALTKIESVDGVHDCHRLHVWSYTNTELVGTLRLHASIGADKQLVHTKVSRILQDAGVLDLTLEVEELQQSDDL